MQVGLIYQYRNKINNKVYIGQTKLSLDKRHSRHIKSLNDKNCNYCFYRALKKYGVENFELTILEENIPLDLLDEKEIYYIRKYDSYFKSNKGYNMTKGGKMTYSSNQNIYGSIENEIKRLLKETNLSFREIAKQLGLKNIYSISEINRGKIFIEKDIKYPIRKTITHKKVTKELFDNIMNQIINTNDSWNKICKDNNTNITLVNKINLGKHKFSDKNLSYPLRKIEQESTYANKLTHNDVIEIIRLLVCENKKVSYIIEKFNVKKNTIGDISRGLTWKIITQQFKCPIIKNKLINKTLFEKIYGIV